jgi:WD40 repeat protein
VPQCVSFSADGKSLVAASGGGIARIWNTETGSPQGSLLPLADGHGTMLSADGHYRGTERAKDAILYVAEQDDGQQATLTPDDFAQRYGWRNDPQRVQGP